LAKLYESTSSSYIYTKTFPKFQKTQPSTKAILPTPNPTHKPIDSQFTLNPTQRQPNKKLTPAFMAERRSKGLCCFCDEQYSPNHALTHKKLEIHVMEVSDIEEETIDQFDKTQEDGGTSLDPQISVNALTDIASFKTMRVTCCYKKKPLHILIDSRNTHNFLDEGVAKKLCCLITDIPILSVAVADGARVSITSTVKQFSWILQNTGFISYMLLIPLCCYDVVLRIEWLFTLGDIT